MACSRLYIIILSLLAVLLYSTQGNGDEYTNYCRNLQKAEPACFNVTTLIECVNLHDVWYGVFLGNCGELCCDASIIGCRINCFESTTTTTSTTTTSTTTVTPTECNAGELESREETCGAYKYCSAGKWVNATCPIGIFDAEHKSCALGKCP